MVFFLWCPEQERFNCFLLNITIYSCASCNYLYTQITQRNPVKRRKGGQKVANLFASHYLTFPRSSFAVISILFKDDLRLPRSFREAPI